MAHSLKLENEINRLSLSADPIVKMGTIAAKQSTECVISALLWCLGDDGIQIKKQ